MLCHGYERINFRRGSIYLFQQIISYNFGYVDIEEEFEVLFGQRNWSSWAFANSSFDDFLSRGTVKLNIILRWIIKISFEKWKVVGHEPKGALEVDLEEK